MRSIRILLLAATLAVAAEARADDGFVPPDTLTGLVGSYTRYGFTPGDGQIVYVTLAGSDGYHAQGPFTRFVAARNGGVALQSGSYIAIGENPAIGAAISFIDGSGTPFDTYFILGIQRDPLGKKIIAIQLLLRDTPIVLHRVGL
jgi:hypothetical protein